MILRVIFFLMLKTIVFIYGLITWAFWGPAESSACEAYANGSWYVEAYFIYIHLWV